MKSQKEAWSIIGYFNDPHVFFLLGHPVEMCLLTNNIHDYHFVSQGKTTIPGLDDGEELLVTDVSAMTEQDQLIKRDKRN